MKIKNILLPFAAIAISGLSYSQTEDVSTYGAKELNWQRKNISGKIMGTNTQKAYDEIIQGQPAKKQIIVAVIDAGVDIYHEDLRDNIWVNKEEIKDNGIDDDGNGYIDDVNGWNFLGNSEGENIDVTTLEKTRIHQTLAPRFEGVREANVAAEDKEDYALFKKLDREITDKVKAAEKAYKEAKKGYENISKAYKNLAKMSGTKIATYEDVVNLNPSSKEEKKLQKQLVLVGKFGYTKKGMNEYMEYSENEKDAYYNTSFDPRKDIIGDDLNDINDRGYGNPDVIGPDAFHGTFCAGLIGASIDNNLGIDGIANNVLIMPIRTVPNGDEYDKDVALAIRYAVDNGANIINMSFGKSYSPNKTMVDEAFAYAESKGVLLVHAAGNDNKNIDFEDNFPNDNLAAGGKVGNLICVGASTLSTKKRIPADFSNFGNENVDIFAPGQDVVSTTTESKYDISQGTSFSAPVVSGIAALVWSYYPELTVAQLKEVIIQSATPLGKKKVVVPGTKSKKRFSELSLSDGVVNTYNAFILADAMLKK